MPWTLQAAATPTEFAERFRRLGDVAQTAAQLRLQAAAELLQADQAAQHVAGGVQAGEHHALGGDLQVGLLDAGAEPVNRR